MAEFPEIRVPAREKLSTYYINDMVRSYMEAAEHQLRGSKMMGLITGRDEDDTTGAFKRFQAIKDRNVQKVILDTARDVIPYLHWKEAREIYDVHPVMTKSLMNMGSEATIPGSTFRRLRHPNPFFTLTGTPEFWQADGNPGRAIGFYVTGAVANQYPRVDGGELLFSELNTPGIVFRGDDDRRGALLKGTHEDGINALHVTVISEVLSHDKTRVLDLDFCHLTIPLTVDFTLDGLVSEISVGGFRWAQAMQGPNIHLTAISSYLSTVARVAVSHLLYACSRTSEISEGKNDRPPVKPGKQKTKARKPAKVHPVGYRTGARIEDVTRRIQERQASGVPTGRRLPPHMRAAHSHLYRVGPGRREIDIKFLDPIPVNMGDDDGSTATVHPMG